MGCHYPGWLACGPLSLLIGFYLFVNPLQQCVRGANLAPTSPNPLIEKFYRRRLMPALDVGYMPRTLDFK